MELAGDVIMVTNTVISQDLVTDVAVDSVLKLLIIFHTHFEWRSIFYLIFNILGLLQQFVNEDFNDVIPSI